MEHEPDAPLSMLHGHPFKQSYNAGTPVHSVKLEAVFQSPLEHLLALAAEFDLQTLWNKVCTLPVSLLPGRWLGEVMSLLGQKTGRSEQGLVTGALQRKGMLT